MFEYEKYGRFFAQVTTGLEKLCAQELAELGARRVKAVYRGVQFNAERAALYRINYMSRLATRVLAPLLTFSCHSTKYLTRTAQNIEWERVLSLDKTFAISASVANSAIDHSLYAAQCLKDGIADYFKAKTGRRPNVDTDNPDVRVNLHIEYNKAIVSLDTSGESLHKRGYRQSAVLAPMQETLAAALVRLSGWNGSRPFWDCLCGSGTILCEALMHYCRIPAQYLRTNFGFFYLPDFEEETWEKTRDACVKDIRPLPKGLIRGSDQSAKAIAISRRNLSRLPHHESVVLSARRFQDAPNFEQGVLVCNPPYGVRMGTSEQTAQLYRELGDFIKRKCLGTQAYILIGDTSLRKSIGLKPSERYTLYNGTITCELLRVDSFRIVFRKKREEGPTAEGTGAKSGRS